jgi:uncharacterized protein (DUF2141 family)
VQFMGLLMGGLLPGLLGRASLQDEPTERKLKPLVAGLAVFGVIPLVVLLFAGPSSAAQPQAVKVGSVRAVADRVDVQVTGLRNDHGVVRCSLYDSADGFPESTRHVVARATGTPSGGSANCRFTGVPRGHDLAVVIYHDENNDAVFQRGAFGVPLEGYGFSNNVVPTVAAPSFQSCCFRSTPGTVGIHISIIY